MAKGFIQLEQYPKLYVDTKDKSRSITIQSTSLQHAKVYYSAEFVERRIGALRVRPRYRLYEGGSGNVTGTRDDEVRLRIFRY